MPGAETKTSLPTVDLRRFEAGGVERAAFLSELRRAARDVGSFYLAGRGVSEGLTQSVIALARRFFALPERDKLAIETVNSPHFRGYTRPGFEYTRGAQDWREQVDIGAERPALPRNPAAPAWTRLQGPNQWPAALPELKPVLHEYEEKVTALAIRVLQAFSVALEQPEDVFEPIYTPAPSQLIKIIRYPGRAAGESDQGVGAHKDSGFLAILLQEAAAGLQVEGDDGWIDAPPVPGTFVVNIGEILELASNGLSARNRPSRRLAARGRRQALGRLLPGRPPRLRSSAAGVAAASGCRGARRHTRPAQPALPRSRP